MFFSDGTEFVHPFFVIVKLGLRHGFARVFDCICEVFHHKWHREFVLHFSYFSDSPLTFKKNSSHGHHSRFSAHVWNICTTIVLGDCDEFFKIDGRVNIDGPQIDSEELTTTFIGRQRDVNSFFESSSDGIVNVLGPIGGREHHHCLQWLVTLTLLLLVICTGAATLPNSVHLDKKLTLHASGCLAFTATSTRCRQCINLIDENGTRSIESSHLEKDAHQFFRITFPFGSECWWCNVEELRFSFSSYSLGKHSFTCARRTKHHNSFPRSSDAGKILWHQKRQ